jgi:hypothetical protein
MYVFTGTDHRMDFYSRTAGQKLTLFYRLPTEDERFGYENGRVKRDKGKVVNMAGRLRREYGLAIITGLGEGCFGKPGGQPDADGKVPVIPVSSDKDSPHYDPKWKTHLKRYAVELVEALAIRIFEEPVVALSPEAEEEASVSVGDDKGAEDVSPEDAEGN